MGNAEINDLEHILRILKQINASNVMNIEVYEKIVRIQIDNSVAQDILGLETHDMRHDLMAIIITISHTHEIHDILHALNDMEVVLTNALNVIQHYFIHLETTNVVMHDV